MHCIQPKWSFLSQLSEAFLSSLEKLMVLLFEVLPRLPPDLQMPTYYAVMRLILGVAANRSALKSFLSHVGSQVTILHCFATFVWQFSPSLLGSLLYHNFLSHMGWLYVANSSLKSVWFVWW